VVQGHASDSERLLKALVDISAWLEPISMEARTFADSVMVSKSLVALYTHIISFWAKACRVYSSSKRTRLFSAVKAIWTDYNKEFAVLKQSMDQELKFFLAAATAEHHREFDMFTRNVTTRMSMIKLSR
jgi:hypothetical protein